MDTSNVHSAFVGYCKTEMRTNRTFRTNPYGRTVVLNIVQIQKSNSLNHWDLSYSFHHTLTVLVLFLRQNTSGNVLKYMCLNKNVWFYILVCHNLKYNRQCSSSGWGGQVMYFANRKATFQNHKYKHFVCQTFFLSSASNTYELYLTSVLIFFFFFAYH